MVVTLAPHGPLHGSLRALDVPAYSLGCHRRLDYVAAIPRLSALLRRCDIVHSHLFDATFVASVAAIRVRRPIVVTRHEGPELARRAPGGGLKRRVYHILDGLLLRSASRVIAPSTAVQRDVIVLGARQSSVTKIPLGLDIERLAATSIDAAARLRSLLASQSAFAALAVGRLSWEKRLDVLLTAWQQVTAVRPDARLLIAGGGPLHGALSDLAARLGIANAVSFLGERTDVPELMTMADVVVHPAEIESTGLVLLEALALRRPLVTTRVGVADEYLADGVHCLVVPPGDANALARGLLSVANDPVTAAARAAAGQLLVNQHSGMSSMVAAYASLYDELRRGTVPGAK